MCSTTTAAATTSDAATTTTIIPTVITGSATAVNGLMSCSSSVLCILLTLHAALSELFHHVYEVFAIVFE